jgi:hypothetical protein
MCMYLRLKLKLSKAWLSDICIYKGVGLFPNNSMCEGKPHHRGPRTSLDGGMCDPISPPIAQKCYF